MKISLCMIVRDEEAVLGRCLSSVNGLFDELVIADTGSTDKTKQIALAFGAKVYDFPWTDDFAAARNFAFSKGTGDYLVWLDADDVIPGESASRFSALRERLEREQPDLVRCPYLSGNVRFYRERFLRRGAGFLWQGRVHECIAPQGKVTEADFAVRHLGSAKPRGMRNLLIYLKWKEEEPLSARDLYYYGRELCYHGLWEEAAAMLETMLHSKGWYVNQIDACRLLALCRERTGDRNAALQALLRSFCFGEPRAAVLCELGRLLYAEHQPRAAAYWYEQALRAPDHSAEGDFEDPDARGLTPLLGLVVCHYALGEREQAAFYHKKTEELAPEHPSVQYNRKFFG